ncbi:MAG: helix-turn-helix transcriptional regulator [Mucilaginibacter sp.]|jgi:transcriptional regulator with XRE-family HTH domain|uniref:helix-turn-helix transcriptional regulator n=1 Tax=Mucilaginibacter sp. TaxID=1882438 RepID=UPI003564B0A2
MIDESQRENYRKVAFNLYTLRISKNLSQQALANRSDVERSKISRIENYSEDFLFSTILKLAPHLDTTTEKILNLNVEVPDTFEANKEKVNLNSSKKQKDHL